MLPLNLDCGELEGDHLLLKRSENYKISYCNISCGQHSGNNKTITEVIKIALAHDIKIGAHPSYPDKDNFGRVSLKMEKADLIKSIIDQLNFLKTIADTFGLTLNHVKAHGALYNDIAIDADIANTFLVAIGKFNKHLKIFTLPDSVLYQLGLEAGFEMIREGFGDRVYENNTTLQSRKIKGALIQDHAKMSQQIENLNNGFLINSKGNQIPLHVDTICLHGDNLIKNI